MRISEHRPVPQTYGQILELVETVQPFDSVAGKLERLAPLRNVLAHEYLDLRYRRLRTFVDDDVDAIIEFAGLLQSWVADTR